MNGPRTDSTLGGMSHDEPAAPPDGRSEREAIAEFMLAHEAALRRRIQHASRGAPGLDPDELQAYLADHLGRFQIPQYLTVTMIPLPRTATGKILKRRLRDEALRDLRAAGLLD